MHWYYCDTACSGSDDIDDSAGTVAVVADPVDRSTVAEQVVSGGQSMTVVQTAVEVSAGQESAVVVASAALVLRCGFQLRQIVSRGRTHCVSSPEAAAA